MESFASSASNTYVRSYLVRGVAIKTITVVINIESDKQRMDNLIANRGPIHFSTESR